MEGFASPGKVNGCANLAYFLTDGAPNRGQGVNPFTGDQPGTTDSGIQLLKKLYGKTFDC